MSRAITGQYWQRSPAACFFRIKCKLVDSFLFIPMVKTMWQTQHQKIHGSNREIFDYLDKYSNIMGLVSLQLAGS